MITTFGNGDSIVRSIILLILSAGVSFFIIFWAVIMIIRANKELRS